MAMAVPTKIPCGAVSSYGTSMVMCGEFPPIWTWIFPQILGAAPSTHGLGMGSLLGEQLWALTLLIYGLP